MKKANSIRLFFFVAALVCCISYGGGYYQSIQHPDKNKENKSSKENIQGDKKPEIEESATVVKPYKFVLGEEDSYVIVYYADAETIYSTTDIKMETLPIRLQNEIRQGKKIEAEKELYNFLENYSS